MILWRFLRANAAFLLAGVLLTFTSSFGQTFFISIFADEIMGFFRLSASGWGAVYGAATLASAAAMIWAGALIDRLSVTQMGVICLGGLALASGVFGTASGVVQLAMGVFALRLMGQGLMTHLAVVSMARWFIRDRGKALGIARLGHSLGEAVLPALTVLALSLLHWRSIWWICLVICLALIPLLYHLLRQDREPRSPVDVAHAAGLDGRHWRRQEVLHDPLFWAAVPMLLGPPTFGTAFFFHQIHIAGEAGWSHLSLVALYPITTCFAIALTLLSGLAIDRFGALRLMPWVIMPFGVFFAVLGITDSLAGAALGLVFFGIGVGANATVPSAFWTELYGTRHIGSIKAMAASIMVFGSALGPPLTGWLIDRGVSMDAQFLGFAVYFAAATLLLAGGVAQRRRLR